MSPESFRKIDLDPKDFMKDRPEPPPEKPTAPFTVEHTGGSVSYYCVMVTHPTDKDNRPYMAECNDIIEALGMTFAEANVFKATWRTAAARTLKKMKKGNENPLYDAEKIVFFGERMIVAAKKQNGT